MRTLGGSSRLGWCARVACCAALLLAAVLLVFGASADRAAGEQAASRQLVTQHARVDTGFEHSCAIAGDGSVRCWGNGASGRLGYANTTTIGDNETPGSVGPVDLGAGRSATAISAGQAHTCALLDNGTVRCWGDGTFGRLGYGNTTTIGDNETPGSVGPVDLGAGRSAPRSAPAPSIRVRCSTTAPSAAGASAPTASSGTRTPPSIGDNETPGSAGPVDLGAGRSATAISAGGFHTCALLDNGTVRCWGGGANGELGYGNTNDIGDNETPGSVGPVDLGRGPLGDRDQRRQLPHLRAARQRHRPLLGRRRRRPARLRQHRPTSATTRRRARSGRSTSARAARRPRSPPAAATPARCWTTARVRCWGFGGDGQLGYGNTDRHRRRRDAGSVGPVDLGAGRTATAISRRRLAHLRAARQRHRALLGLRRQRPARLRQHAPPSATTRRPARSAPVDLGAGRTGDRDHRRRRAHLRAARRRHRALLGLRRRRPARLRQHRPASATTRRPASRRAGRPRRRAHATAISRRRRATPARCSTTAPSAAGASAPTAGSATATPTTIGDNETPGLGRSGRPRRGPHGDRDQRRQRAHVRAARQRHRPLLGRRRQRPARLRQHHHHRRQRDARARSGRSTSAPAARRTRDHAPATHHTCALLDNGTVRCWGVRRQRPARLRQHRQHRRQRDARARSGRSTSARAAPATAITAGERTPARCSTTAPSAAGATAATASSATATPPTSATTRRRASVGPVDLGAGRIGDRDQRRRRAHLRAARQRHRALLGRRRRRPARLRQHQQHRRQRDAGLGRSGRPRRGPLGDRDQPPATATPARCSTTAPSAAGARGSSAGSATRNTTTIGDNETPGPSGRSTSFGPTRRTPSTTARRSSRTLRAAAITVLGNDTDIDGGPKAIVSATDPPTAPSR